ncbi:polysaccharide biosynthesis protein [Sphingomonas turrisvirgatae]|uniref:polysaccharide biosynthesis protein n=1 Tax=Sphingomonas turrisvirgatae TaxID=1888892 RepID=UPI0019D3ABBD|nr:nucleoside-diphosphate sugar epimerase/dehydratase [Sphingomonas turrisvirgatae]
MSDALSCALASLIAIYLRLGYVPQITKPIALSLIFSVALCLLIFWIGGSYRTLFRYVGETTVKLLSRNLLVYAIPYAIIFTYYGVPGVPRTIGLLQPAILLLVILAERTLLAQIISLSGVSTRVADRPTVLIYGSGSAGRQLLGALRQSREMIVAGFVDDDLSLSGQTLDGLHVYRPAQLRDVIAKRQVSDVFLAIPSATRKRRNEIVAALRAHSVNVRTLPGMLDLAHGRVKVSDLREVETDDLLGRNRVAPNDTLLRRNITGKRVLVTGAGGSIGSELCRQIIDNAPAAIFLLDHSEFALYAIHRELTLLATQEALNVEIFPVLGSVAVPDLVGHVFAAHKPDVVFHAAAYKHVPLVEENVVEAVRNNVLGTANIALAALRHDVAHVVLISTDKAVRPTSIMGTTKRLAEQILQALAAKDAKTCFSMVRFGNVLGSSGSVVPLFRAQAHAGGPVTITHREMTRYFMVIPEAAQLVIQAGAMARGGEVFLLDMGDPVKIIDLARSVIALSGLTVRDADNPEGDVEIREVGLRPGEKLYEELLIDTTSEPSDHPLIMKANESFISWDALNPALERLAALITANDAPALIAELKRLVPEFTGYRQD